MASVGVVVSQHGGHLLFSNSLTSDFWHYTLWGNNPLQLKQNFILTSRLYALYKNKRGRCQRTHISKLKIVTAFRLFILRAGTKL